MAIKELQIVEEKINLDKKVSNFINKGGTPTQNTDKKECKMPLRIPQEMLFAIDEIRINKKRGFKLSRNAIILEALDYYLTMKDK